MSVTRVDVKTAGTTNGSAFTPANTPANANNLRVLWVAVWRNNANPACATPAGWTACTPGQQNNLNVRFSIFGFYQFCAGGESAPTVSYTGDAGLAILEEATGFGAGSTVDVANVLPVFSTNGTGATLTNGTLATTTNDDYISSFGATRNGGATPTFTWGGGSSVDLAPVSDGANLAVGLGKRETSASGNYAPTLQFATTGASVTGLASMAFKVVTPKTGSASGTFRFTGSATGSSTHRGSATGTASFAGSATGRTQRKGSTTGTASFAGSAVGSTPRRGATAGTASFAGSATGAMTRSGSASGAVTFAGSASGLASDNIAHGTVTWTASATGASPRHGSATGTVLFDAFATGITPSHGSATGAATFAGSASGTSVGPASAPSERTLVLTIADRRLVIDAAPRVLEVFA